MYRVLGENFGWPDRRSPEYVVIHRALDVKLHKYLPDPGLQILGRFAGGGGEGAGTDGPVLGVQLIQL